MVVVITCEEIIICHPALILTPPSPTPPLSLPSPTNSPSLCSSMSLSLSPPPQRLQPNQNLQRRVLLSRAVQEKMAAVSRSCVHICQEVTVQEKMGSWVFSFSTFSKPACVGDGWLCSVLFPLCFFALDCTYVHESI